MITKEYIEGLQNKIEQIVDHAGLLLDVGDGEFNVSLQRSNADMAFYAELKQLQGYVEVLNPDGFPSQNQ